MGREVVALEEKNRENGGIEVGKDERERELLFNREYFQFTLTPTHRNGKINFKLEREDSWR